MMLNKNLKIKNIYITILNTYFNHDINIIRYRIKIFCNEIF